MQKAALLAHLHAAWSRKPQSVALLTPSGAGTETWTFQGLSSRVSPSWPCSVGDQPEHYCLTIHISIMTGGCDQRMDTPDDRGLEASGAGRQSHSGTFDGHRGAIYADRPQLPACWVVVLQAWSPCNAVVRVKRTIGQQTGLFFRYGYGQHAHVTFLWSNPDVTSLLSSQSNIHAARPLMARPHPEWGCGELQIGALQRFSATR
jgi:hypothetical protein